MTRRDKSGEAEIRRKVGAAIRARAEKAEIGPAVLAQAAEIDDSQVSKVLAGKVGLSLYSLARVAAVLGTTASVILADAFPEGVVARSPRSQPRRPSDRTS